MLVLKSIDASYDNVKVLKNVSLEIAQKEVVTLVGTNGAGKSTTLRVITGLLNPDKGSVELMGENITGLKPYRIVQRGISLVPEGRRIFLKLTVQENLELGGYQNRLAQKSRQFLQEVFDLFPVLAERRNQIGATLSGGEQQMLAIGRALMASPKLLLLDEPSLGLAPIIVREIFEIIRNIHKKGTTILLIEQNVQLALEIADRGYVIQTGQIILSDTASNLRNNEMVIKAYLGGARPA